MESNSKVPNSPPSKEETRTETSYNQNQEEANSSFSLSQLFKDTGKQGLKAMIWFLIVLILFGVINTPFLLYSSYNYSQTKLAILALFIGFGCTILAFFLTYRYILTDTLRIAYKYLTPLFKKLCIKITDTVVAGGNKITGKDIGKSLNVGSLMIEIYGSELPKYVQKGLRFIINRIPFSDFLKDMQKDLSEKKDNRTLSEILYKHVDTYMLNIFRKNSIKLVFILLGLNIVLQVILIVLLS